MDPCGKWRQATVAVCVEWPVHFSHAINFFFTFCCFSAGACRTIHARRPRAKKRGLWVGAKVEAPVLALPVPPPHPSAGLSPRQAVPSPHGQEENRSLCWTASRAPSAPVRPVSAPGVIGAGPGGVREVGLRLRILEIYNDRLRDLLSPAPDDPKQA